MRWLLLLLAVLSELGGSKCMKLSNEFANIYASILTFVFWGISCSIFIFALKHFDLSFIYAIWAGIGIMLVSINKEETYDEYHYFCSGRIQPG